MVLAMDDASTDPRCAELLDNYLPANNIKSMLDAPFLYDGKLAGVLCIEQVGEPRTWTAEEKHFSTVMASLLSIAMEREKRKLVELDLTREKERYQQLAYSSPEGIGILVDGVVEFANPALNKIAEKAGIGDIVERSLDQFFSPADAQLALDRQKAIIESKSSLPPREYKVPQADGSDFYVEVSSIYVKWNGRDAVQSNVRDVTDNVVTRKALETYAEQLRILGHSFPGGFTYATTDMVFQNINATFTQWCNTTRDKIVGSNIREFLGEDLYADFMPDLDDVLAGHNQTFEIIFHYPGQPGREVRISHVPDQDVMGNVRGFFTLLTDLTQFKETERALRHAQKMEAVGQLTGGLAHDFNNLLLIVMGNLELIKNELPADLDLDRFLDNAITAAKRGANLTRKLLGFSRENPAHPEAVDINQTIQKLLSLLNKSMTARVIVNLNLQPDLWPVNLNVGDLEDAILNLALNARDAMNGTGQLTISTRNVEKNGQQHVLVSVTDEGCGIADDIKDRIFDPFYTTKSEDKGSGLGLSMVYGFVKRSKGTIEVESEPGKGTTFNLYLPRDAAISVEETTPQATPDALPRGEETILVVDDESALLQTVSRMLDNLGYQTIQAGSGIAALEKLSEHPQIDMIFTDVVLGGDMDGYGLVLQAMKARPDIKVLMTSGYNTADTQHNGGLWPDYKLLSKPYKMKDLANAVRSSLDDFGT